MGKLTNWKDHTVHALEETCRGLQLESGGSRPDLVARLIDYELEKMQLDFQRFCISPDADPQGKKKLLMEANAIRKNFELGASIKKAAFYEYANSIEKDALQNSSQKYKENIALIEKMAHKQEFVVPIRPKQQPEESLNSADLSFEEAKPEGTEMKKGGIGIEAAREGIVCKEVVGKQSAEKQAIENGLFKKDQDKVVRFEKSQDALTNPSAVHLGGEKGGKQSRKVGRSTEIRRAKSDRNVSGGVKGTQNSKRRIVEVELFPDEQIHVIVKKPKQHNVDDETSPCDDGDFQFLSKNATAGSVHWRPRRPAQNSHHRIW